MDTSFEGTGAVGQTSLSSGEHSDLCFKMVPASSEFLEVNYVIGVYVSAVVLLVSERRQSLEY